MGWLKQAFAVDPPGPAEPTAQQQPAIDWLCIQVAKRRLTTPGLITLEMIRPLNWVASQTMHAMQPGISGAVWAVLPGRHARFKESYKGIASFLEHRGSIEYVARRVEYFEEAFTKLEKSGESIRLFIKDHMSSVRKAAQRSDAPDEAQSTEEA